MIRDFPGDGPAVVLGLGTGRCGTQSLARLLAVQPGVIRSRHEHFFLPWLGAGDPVWRRRAEDLLPERAEHTAGIYCEVASWYLPYAAHLLKAATNHGTPLRGIILERPATEVIASFLRKVGPFRNHWQPHDGRFDPFDPCFPQFSPELTREQALLEYCTVCQTEGRRLEEAYPGCFRRFDLTSLADPESATSLLHWCGVSQPYVEQIPRIAS
jgi:hypothetical protein